MTFLSCSFPLFLWLLPLTHITSSQVLCSTPRDISATALPNTWQHKSPHNKTKPQLTETHSSRQLPQPAWLSAAKPVGTKRKEWKHTAENGARAELGQHGETGLLCCWTTLWVTQELGLPWHGAVPLANA